MNYIYTQPGAYSRFWLGGGKNFCAQREKKIREQRDKKNTRTARKKKSREAQIFFWVLPPHLKFTFVPPKMNFLPLLKSFHPFLHSKKSPLKYKHT